MTAIIATGRQVPVRVQLPAGQAATVRLPGLPDTPLDGETLATLLALGLQLPPQSGDQPKGNATLEVDESARFFIGATPLADDLALQAIARAIARAIHEAADELLPVPERSLPVADLDAASEPPPGATRVPVSVAERDLEALMDRVAAGERITLTREDEAVAAIVPWRVYRDLRERLAKFQHAHWAATQDDGAFDVTVYRRLVDGADA